MNTGGPAFPAPEAGQHHFSDVSAYMGMTLRDYFAAKAMQGLMGRTWDHADPNEIFSIWARSAYAVADAMLKAREQ